MHVSATVMGARTRQKIIAQVLAFLAVHSLLGTEQ